MTGTDRTEAVPLATGEATGNRSGLLKTLGPGLIWAATAVGVSHLVQSTRAGADYGGGTALGVVVAVVLLANLLKYPFFEFGPRYAAATGESLLEGYARLGRWAVGIYVVVTVGTMFTVQAAVTLVTASLATQLFGGLLTPFGYSVGLLAICAVLLIVGRYPLLDAVVKVIVVLLTLSTLVALVSALIAGPGEPSGPAAAPRLGTAAAFAFMIALVGWMPSAIDISVWHSLWTLERSRQTGYRPRLSEVLFDFRLGYFGTAGLALVFLALGALVIHGSGRDLPSGAADFAAAFIAIYTDTLGAWSRPLIAVAAFTTMFSTTLAVTDGFPRVLQRATGLLTPRVPSRRLDALYWVWMLVIVVGALLVIRLFLGRLTLMVDVATTLSFLTAPVLSWFNLKAVTGPAMPAGTEPPRWLRSLAWAGLVLGAVFAFVYVAWRVSQG